MALVPIIFGILVFGTLGLTQFAFAGALVNTVTIDGADTQGDCENNLPLGLEGNFDGINDICTLQVPLDLQIVITIDGITLDCNNQIIQSLLPDEGTGIAVIGSTNVEIKNCIINDFENNIVINNSNNNMIHGNILNEAGTSGISLVNSDENMIFDNGGVDNDFLLSLSNSDNNTVEFNGMSDGQNAMAMDGSNGNTIRHNSMFQNSNSGFQVFGGGNNIIFDNTIGTNADYGLRIENSNDNEIIENQIDDNDNGLVIFGGARNMIFDNTFQNNFGDGLNLSNSNDNQIMGNQINSNSANFDSGHFGYGISMDGSDSNTIFENNISNNEAEGIALFGSSNNIIFNNNLVNNPNQILDDFGVNNQFNQPLPIGGNYYDTFDESGEGCQDVAPANGICDDPFVFSGGQDSLPWTKPNGWLNPPPPQAVTVTIDGADTQGDCEKLLPDGLGGIFASNTCTLQTPITGNVIINNINDFNLDCDGKSIDSPVPEQGTGILVNASSAVTIQNCVVNLFDDNILIKNSNKNIISGNTLNESNTNGILLDNSHENEVEFNDGMGNDFLVTLRNSNDNNVRDNTMSQGENVMAVENSSGNTIADNFMGSNPNMGFGLFNSRNNTISGNTIDGNGEFGLKLTNSPGNVIKNNQITFNGGDGLVLENSEGNIITDNEIKSNMGDGIRLLNSNKNKLMGNLIDASMPNIDSGGLGDGIFIENSQLNTISKNDITNNEVNGIDLFDSSDNIIINNNFVNNPNHILDDFGVNNQFNQPLPVGGNYYDTFDESGEGCQDVAPANGICDDPFVFSGGQDSLPWTKPNGWLNPPQPPKTIYKGEGQRADVNEFLMYTSPKEGSTILPSRTSNYMLEIMYGDTINPSTFSAKMGKNDITSLFNPQPDKTEKISIPLIDGKNSLSLSVEGIRSDGKKSSDKDKLVFIVGGAMQQGLSPDQGLDWFIPPIKQVKQGTLAQDVVCQPQLDLIFKSSDGSPKCVSSIAAEKLVERGWATR